MEYITSKQAAEKWGISANRVTILCKDGRIHGALRIGTQWMIPAETGKPADGRTKKAKETADEAYFRFPFYVNTPENGFNPPLSEDERALREAQLDFFSCRFEQAGTLLSALEKNDKDICIRISALFFECLISIYNNRAQDLQPFFARMGMLLNQEFPHKQEMSLFLPWFYAFTVNYKAACKFFQFIPNYSYSPDCLPLIGYLSFSVLTQADPVAAAMQRFDLYELQCRQAELSGHFYEATEMHFLLFECYNMTINKSLMFYHLRQALSLAKDHGLMLLPACYAFFFPREFKEVLPEFPKKFTEELYRIAPQVYRSGSYAVSKIGNNNLYVGLDPKDYQLICYTFMGYSNRQIAGFMKKSEKTVSNHFNEIYNKLGISGKKELEALLNTMLH